MTREKSLFFVIFQPFKLLTKKRLQFRQLLEHPRSHVLALNWLHYVIFQPFKLLTKKRLHFRQLLEHPRSHVLALNWLHRTHLKYYVNIFLVGVQIISPEGHGVINDEETPPGQYQPYLSHCPKSYHFSPQHAFLHCALRFEFERFSFRYDCQTSGIFEGPNKLTHQPIRMVSPSLKITHLYHRPYT